MQRLDIKISKYFDLPLFYHKKLQVFKLIENNKCNLEESCLL